MRVEPILIGDLVSVQCRLIHTGTSSMHFTVDVRARNLKSREIRLATSCVIMFVALDSPDGMPTPVPTWTPQTNEDRRLAEYATRLVDISKAMEEQIATSQPGAFAD